MSSLWISQVIHQDPKTGINVGSPTLERLDSGEILAAHDYRRNGKNGLPEGDGYTMSVYRSSNRE